uniref:Uncharacterized protein n=1 Tax=Taeniopygia guttata TaxID=59729 RepID=A0A674GGA9_TAEGU
TQWKLSRNLKWVTAFINFFCIFSGISLYCNCEEQRAAHVALCSSRKLLFYFRFEKIILKLTIAPLEKASEACNCSPLRFLFT